MVTHDFCGVPPQSPHLGFTHRGKQQFCNSYWFTVICFSTGSQGQWEVNFESPSIGRAVRFHFFVWKITAQLTMGSCIAVTFALSGIYWLHPVSRPAVLPSTVLCSYQPKEVLPTSGFLPSPGRASTSGLQGCICRRSALSSLLISLFIHGCPSLEVSMCGFHRCTSIYSAGNFSLNYSWLISNFRGRGQGALFCCHSSDVTSFLIYPNFIILFLRIFSFFIA